MTPETFKANGHAWTKHTPGNPMPCESHADVIVLWREELDSDKAVFFSDLAKGWCWSALPHMAGKEVVGWRYAATPQEKDEHTRLREENASLRAAIKAGYAALERAHMVHKAITTYSKQNDVDFAANVEHCGIMSDALAKLQPYTA